MYLFSRVFLFLFSICNCAKHINPSIINMNVLVTGAAGFIGSNLCMRLLEELSDTLVVGLDNLNAYYDVNIKRWRALCPAARRSLAQDLPRLPPGTAHKGGTRAIFWRYGPKAAGRSRRR